MRKVVKEIRFGGAKKSLYYEQFSSYEEYARVVEEREKANSHDRDMSLEHICDDSDWVGAKSFEEAKGLLMNGWDASVEELKKGVAREMDMAENKRAVKEFPDVVGYMPIVAKAVMGLPDCMLNQRKEIKKTKVVKFLVAMNRASRYSSQSIIDKMSRILARIALLEKSGYRCRIEIFGSFHSGKERGSRTIACHSVMVKSEMQPFDMRRLAFPIAHSAMQRCFGFAWENSLPIEYGSYHNDGLGRSVQYWEDAYREDLLGALNEKNERIVLVGMETDLDKAFGKEVIGG